MKKWIGLFVVACMLFSTTAAFAESSADSVYNAALSDETDQYFTTSGTIDNCANGFVTIVVTNTDTITVDSIMYIDQTVADGSGGFSFENYIPKVNVPEGEKYPVKIGATALSTPISGGYLQLPGAGYTVSGSVAFKGEATKATVALSQGTQVVQSIETAAGNYTVANVQDGVYTLTATKQSHLPYSTSVTVSGGNVTVPAITMIAGDCNGDKSVGLADLTALIKGYGKAQGVTGYDVLIDLDESGDIGLTDLTLLINSYGKAVE